MRRIIQSVSVLLVLAVAAPAGAAVSNIEVGNTSDGDYVTREERGATRHKLFNFEENEFITTELERSGLKQVGEGLKNIFDISRVKGIGDFFKNQQERYRERTQSEV